MQEVHERFRKQIADAVRLARTQLCCNLSGMDTDDLRQDATLALIEASPKTPREARCALTKWKNNILAGIRDDGEFWSEQLHDDHDGDHNEDEYDDTV